MEMFPSMFVDWKVTHCLLTCSKIQIPATDTGIVVLATRHIQARYIWHPTVLGISLVCIVTDKKKRIFRHLNRDHLRRLLQSISHKFVK